MRIVVGLASLVPPYKASTRRFSGDKIVGPNDSPVSQIEALGLAEKGGRFEPLTDDKFTVTDYQPDVPRDLFFRTADRILVGYLHLEGAPPADLTLRLTRIAHRPPMNRDSLCSGIRENSDPNPRPRPDFSRSQLRAGAQSGLKPSVTVRGQLIEMETDEPAAEYHVYCDSSKQGKFRIDDTVTDKKDRLEIKGLVAGNVYQMNSFNVQRHSNGKNRFTIDLTDAKPGDLVELGEVTGKNAKRKE